MDGRASILIASTLTVALLSGCVADLDGDTDKVITMWVEQKEWEVHPDVFTTVWAFCAEGYGVELMHGEQCSVPGPTIRVHEGDHIKLHFRNDHGAPHTVHFHGWHNFAADMNGNRLLGGAMVADPGETETIEWIANPEGSFIYHCHFDTPLHLEMGMYGAFIVEGRNTPRADVDVPLVIDEWQIREPGEERFIGNMPDYNYFTINGKSFPLTAPIVAEQGETVRLHMVNAGYQYHAIHIHGYTPDAREGVAHPNHAVRTDVRSIAPGQTVVFDFEADREGVWLIHDHVVPSVTAASNGEGFGVYPRGMLTMLIVGDEYLQAIQDAVPGLVDMAKMDHGHGSSHSEGESSESAQSAAPSSNGVVSPMKDLKFEPEIRIKAGQTVTWENEDSFAHTVTSEDGLFDSGNVGGGKSWSYKFDTPGEYPYYCVPHAWQEDGQWKGMTGTVIVE